MSSIPPRVLAALLLTAAVTVCAALGYGLGVALETVLGWVAMHGVKRVEAALEELK